MVLYDGIIFSLQQSGGVSVLFTELMTRLDPSHYALAGYGDTPPPGVSATSYHRRHARILERYRAAKVDLPADIFHSTYYRLPDRPGARVVTTVYDYVYERFAGRPQRMVHSWQKQKAIAGADLIICISESTRRDLLKFAGAEHAARAVVVHLAASDEFQPEARSVVTAQVLFVGKRGGYKNFAAVVAALSTLPEVSLLCVGGGALTAAEVALLEQSLPGRYRAAGHLSTAQLNHEYNTSLCLAYPSLYEGFGIPVLEAMQSGCPVIAVNASSIPEVAGDAAWLMDSGEPEAIRTAVAAMMEGPTRGELVEKGLTQAAKFSWERMCSETLAHYDSLCRS